MKSIVMCYPWMLPMFYNGKNIILRPAKLKGYNGKCDIYKLPEWNLHILKCKFEI